MAKTVSLKADQKAILLSSLAQYLERNGFSKTLKKLQSEAKIEKDGIKGTTPDLEEIYKTYFDSCVEVQLEEPNDKLKEKKKKKSKVLSESLGDQVESLSEPESKDVSKSEKVKKSKDKKKKKENVTSVDNTKEEQDDNKTSKVDVAIEEGKASKKRKRVASEETDAQLADGKAVEESICGKAEVDAKNGEDNKAESDQVGLDDTEKTPMKMNNVQENGNIEKSTGKVAKKQRTGSAEPTSLKAFQRIKLDEVVFTDERLQDNSYWAKGGAETGYGAKAQEVLGQVRGRGFRHEKTKKKRGSYRGGQIDLQSHSVKFNYSDEE